MRHARSLRLHVVLIASALAAAVSIVIGAVALVSLNGYLVDQLDRQLTVAARHAVELTAFGRQPILTAPSPVIGSTPPNRDAVVGAPGQRPGTVTGIFQGETFLVGGWVDATGTRHDLTAEQQGALAAVPADAAPVTVDLGGSLGRYRIAARSGVIGPAGAGGPAVVVTGLPMDSVRGIIDQLELVVVLVGVGSVLLAIVAAALAMGRALRPLRRVASTAAAVTSVPLDRGEVTLAERVDPRDIASTAEVGQVGTALNDLLDHVERALALREESESTVRRFVADASHELRTPLATIRAYAQLSGRPDAEAAEIRGNAVRIDHEGVRMAALIDQLLLLARLDALPELAQEDVDLQLLVAEAVGAARLAGPDHAWILELGEDPALVRGDAADLRRVVDNLLANARLHTPAGTTVRAKVEHGTSADGTGSARLVVADDGPGLPDGLRETVFERFARGDASRSRGEGGGTGLGLAIARAVVEAHGGTIAAESGAGATFVVTLPLASTEPSRSPSARTTLDE
ncbi:HAMP domain-containing sensor histidine kinase [Microbacterium capsulatum]|uniref:histidine kinase n=1 Tax=Microbacterium capsulatum TaxID=3041921 RepID=A0ABU0XKE8_9MICO|nr:HAMP domain-containing sensor histidine kinase [Microbacterium sp. ASV81]MDQ4215596.1 HAMP domain-containing sensor histidine kinase [Microbacterium sp. ASV81]